MRMMIRQATDQMARFSIDPLIDRFVAKDGVSLLFSEFACDDFRGPFLADPGFHLRADGPVFKAGAAVAVLMADSGEKLSMKRVIIPMGEVTSDLSREGGVRPSQGPSDGSQGLAKLQEPGKNTTFFFVQMCIGFHRPPFYPKKPLQLVVH